MPKVKKQRSVLAVTRPPSKHKVQKQQKQQQPPQQPNKQQQQLLNKQHQQPNKQQPAWRCASVIDQQAAEAVARLLAAAETRSAGATIKSLTLAPHVVHKKATFAVTCETLRHLPLLRALLGAAPLLQQHAPQLTPSVAYVLCYELLFGQGFRGSGPAERAVRQQQEQLKAALQAQLDAAGVQDAAGWLQQQPGQQEQQQQQREAAPHPRTARVNTLKASVAEVLQQLAAAPPAAAAGSGKRGGGAGAGAAAAAVQQVAVDELLPDVLVFPPGTDLHDHPLVESGVLVLQSKASCMPAHALAPQAAWQVLDCCAAPGNKTTHVAALLHAASSAAAAAADGGRRSSKKRKAGAAAAAAALPPPPCVLAFDKDPKRAKRLAANVARLGAAQLVQVTRGDFLAQDLSAPEFAQVRGVILDPSCSGSGTVVSRMDHLLPSAEAAGTGSAAAGDDEGGGSAAESLEQQRVEQLAKFQEAALRHALTLPALSRLVYSTCSLHRRENEDVVAAVLPDAAARGFRLVDPFPRWRRRGLPVVQGWQRLVRTDPYEDGTDGFFVAVFERQQHECVCVATNHTE